MILHQQQNKASLQNYKEIAKLGEGAYGQVYLYQRIKPNEHDTYYQQFMSHREPQSQYFALKKYKGPSNNIQGLDISALREINFAMLADNKHVTSSYQVIYRTTTKKHQVYLVMDFLLDLNTILMSSDLMVDDLMKKNICYQILLGIKYLHQNYFIHRDLKPDNIFCSRKGSIKVADFGFTKQFGTPYKALTSSTCTTQYRSPQVFFGTHFYTEKSDIWAYGCIVAYVFKNQALFSAKSYNQLQILSKIFYLRGTPTEKTWPHFQKFPGFKNFQKCQPKNLEKQLEISRQLAQFLDYILQLDPKKRPSANQILSHKFFSDMKYQPLIVERQFTKKIEQILTKKIIKGNQNHMDIQN